MFDFVKYKRIKSRSVSAENFNGEKGKGGMATEGMGKIPAGELGRPFKISPCVNVPASSAFTVCDIKGSGEINHIWMTCAPVGFSAFTVEFYYDGSAVPSVSMPLGKLFAIGHDEKSLVNSLAVTVNPAGGMNMYWPVPFRKGVKITLTNTSEQDIVIYYQVDYQLKRIPRSACYFHAFYRESLPVEHKRNHVVLEKTAGRGAYVGTFMTYKTDFTTWWGEGEFKFFLDGDGEYPTICGTGTEDYFGGAWNFEQPQGRYRYYSTAYQGLVDVIPKDKIYIKDQRFSMYRWHLTDPVYFGKDIRVEVQAIGWQEDMKNYRLSQAEITTVAIVYLHKITNVKGERK